MRRSSPIPIRVFHTFALFFTPFILFSFLTLFLPASPAHAAITIAGDVAPANTSDWIFTTGFIGKTAAGSLTVDAESVFNANTVQLGYEAGSTGAVKVDGSGSQWNIEDSLTVGNHGNGSFNVTNGGAAYSGSSFVGMCSNSFGTVVVDGSGSTWTTGGSDFFVGNDGNGMLYITNGGTISNPNDCDCYISRDNGFDSNWDPIQPPMPSMVTVDGSGSTWANHGTINLGLGGCGMLNITNGGTVDSDLGIVNGGYAHYWTNEVTVAGIGSTWNTTFLDMGYSNGPTLLRIKNGGAIHSGGSRIGYQGTSWYSIVAVEGFGSTWSNINEVVIGCGSGKTTVLSVTGGGVVTASYGSIDYCSIFAVDVGRNSLFSVGSDTLRNNGIVRYLAGVSVEAGGPYTPIIAGTWSGTGTFQAVGGTLDTNSHQFTVSEVVAGTAGTPIILDLAERQRVLVDDDVTFWNIGASFLHHASSSTLSFTAATISGGTLSGLESLMAAGKTVLSGWELMAEGAYAVGDPMYLSFDVGHAQLLDDLQVWQYGESGWTLFDAIDLTYDRTYASLTATAMGCYAVTGDLVLDGDANRDGSTNGTDLNVVLSHYNTGADATWAMGDFNGDGSVNGTDLNTLLSNYNHSLPTAASAVPEPTMIWLLLGLALAGLARRRM